MTSTTAYVRPGLACMNCPMLFARRMPTTVKTTPADSIRSPTLGRVAGFASGLDADAVVGAAGLGAGGAVGAELALGGAAAAIGAGGATSERYASRTHDSR